VIVEPRDKTSISAWTILEIYLTMCKKYIIIPHNLNQLEYACTEAYICHAGYVLPPFDML
jgi:hypothetical protein